MLFGLHPNVYLPTTTTTVLQIPSISFLRIFHKFCCLSNYFSSKLVREFSCDICQCNWLFLTWCGEGPWPAVCSQFSCRMHWRVASTECEMPSVPLLSISKSWSQCSVQYPFWASSLNGTLSLSWQEPHRIQAILLVRANVQVITGLLWSLQYVLKFEGQLVVQTMLSKMLKMGLDLLWLKICQLKTRVLLWKACLSYLFLQCF